MRISAFFQVAPRTGRTVTVSVPYNARQSAIEDFRSLRRGDLAGVEGEFVNSDNFAVAGIYITARALNISLR